MVQLTAKKADTRMNASEAVPVLWVAEALAESEEGKGCWSLKGTLLAWACTKKEGWQHDAAGKLCARAAPHMLLMLSVKQKRCSSFGLKGQEQAAR